MIACINKYILKLIITAPPNPFYMHSARKPAVLAVESVNGAAP